MRLLIRGLLMMLLAVAFILFLPLRWLGSILPDHPPRCPICGEDRLRQVDSMHISSREDPGRRTYFYCRACTVVHKWRGDWAGHITAGEWDRCRGWHARYEAMRPRAP